MAWAWTGESVRVFHRSTRWWAAVLLAVLAGCGSSSPPVKTSPPGGTAPPARRSASSEQLIYRAAASGAPAGPAAVAAAVTILQHRISALELGTSASVAAHGAEITLQLPAGSADSAQLVTTSGHLEIYDWEANVLAPSGQPVAGLLQSQSRAAITISQGLGSLGPGSAAAGGMSLYDAVELARRQPRQLSPDTGRAYPEYFLFGAPGSRACAALGRARGTASAPGQHCLLSGPDGAISDLDAGVPAGVGLAGTQRMVVQPGTAVVQAVPTSFAQPAAVSDAAARFFVLRDRPALSGAQIVSPRASTDPQGQPDVVFDFTSQGAAAFQRATAQVARRGEVVSLPASTFIQHFAVALDAQLVTVPAVDFRTYPAGIPGNNGALVTGGFNRASAQYLATLLAAGPLPVALDLVAIRCSPRNGAAVARPGQCG